jgi:hypothetical protein
MALVKALPSLEKLNLYGNAIRSLPEVSMFAHAGDSSLCPFKT